MASCLAFLPVFTLALVERHCLADDQEISAIEPETGDDSEQANNDATREKLAKRIEAGFNGAPLGQVLEHIGEALGVEIYVQHAMLEELGVTLDSPVSVNLKRVRGSMLLDLALEQASRECGYAVRDGIVIIGSKVSLADHLAVRVYNCRDLLPGEEEETGAAAALSKAVAGLIAGMEAEGSDEKTSPGTSGLGGILPPGMSGMPGMGGVMRPRTPAEQLQHVIRTTISPESWDEAGRAGTMEEFRGLIVVNQSEEVHARIAELLAMLREAAEE
jgi:hypothetical protein